MSTMSGLVTGYAAWIAGLALVAFIAHYFGSAHEEPPPSFAFGGSVSVVSIKASNGRFLRQANGGQLGITEHSAGDKVVVHLSRPAAEAGIGEGATLIDRHRREVHPVGDITDRIDVRNGRA